jgi:hypothetical protein
VDKIEIRIYESEDNFKRITKRKPHRDRRRCKAEKRLSSQRAQVSPPSNPSCYSMGDQSNMFLWLLLLTNQYLTVSVANTHHH